MKPGDPGLDTWPNLDAARHGGGQVWIPGVYDPETHLYIFGTGNPTPGYTGVARQGDNLFTCSLVAVNVDTGKMAWYLQTSPHDTHDWDSAQTPILVDGNINGKPREARAAGDAQRLFLHARSRDGQALRRDAVRLDDELGEGDDERRHADPDPGKEATIPGSLVSPVEGGVTNWPPPAYSPDTGLFYVHEHNGFNLLYLTDPDPRGSMGLGGKQAVPVGSDASYLTAIDYKTGKVAWRHAYPGVNGGGGGTGLLTTAGNLIFAGDGGQQFRRVRRDQRQAAVAHAHRRHLERAADLRCRRPAVRPRRRRRHALRVHAELALIRAACSVVEGRIRAARRSASGRRRARSRVSPETRLHATRISAAVPTCSRP